MPFTTGFYNSGNIRYFNGTSVPTGIFNISITTSPVTSGIDIDITVTNLTSGNQSGIAWNFDMGWGVSGTDPLPNNVWLADPSFNRDALPTGFVDIKANFYGTSNYTSNDINRSLWSPCMVFDRSGTRAIGFSTNYPNPIRITPTMSGTRPVIYTQGCQITPAHPTYGTFMPQDFFTSGSSITFKAWLREHSGSVMTTGIALDLCKPYTDWFATNFPNRRNVPANKKRVYGFFFAQSESSGNPRSYNIFSGGLQPWNSSTDWFKLFDTLPSPAKLKSKGCEGIMFWNMAGTSPGQDFPSVSFTDLPSHLREKVWQIPEWGRKNNINVYAYHASTWYIYQDKNWNDPFKYNSIQRSGSLGTDFTFQQATRPVFSPTGYQKIKDETINGWLVYTDALGMDACPSVTAVPWVSGALIEIRESRPNKFVFTEALTDDRSQSFCLSAYYPYRQWDGINCPLVNRLFGDNNNIIIINQFDYPNPTTLAGRQNFVSGVLQAEAAGLKVVFLSDSTAFEMLDNGSGIQNFGGLDIYKNKTGKRIN